VKCFTKEQQMNVQMPLMIGLRDNIRNKFIPRLCEARIRTLCEVGKSEVMKFIRATVKLMLILELRCYSPLKYSGDCIWSLSEHQLEDNCINLRSSKARYVARIMRIYA